jgi:hypothetical protein
MPEIFKHLNCRRSVACLEYKVAWDGPDHTMLAGTVFADVLWYDFLQRLLGVIECYQKTIHSTSVFSGAR